MKTLQSELAKGTSSNGTPIEDESIQITLRLSKRDLALIDEEAAKRRISRSGLLRQAVFQVINKES